MIEEAALQPVPQALLLHSTTPSVDPSRNMPHALQQLL
jgi:hypothetical protein